MDFCIADFEEELVKGKNFSEEEFFSRNLVTFIDFQTFEEQYLTSYEYNDSMIRKIGLFSLQPMKNFSSLCSVSDNEVKLR